MKSRFLSPAQAELREAFDYYEHEHPGLGSRFLFEIDSAIERVKLAPRAWTLVGMLARRCLLKSFPYAVLYILNKEEIVVVAVAHLRRDPLSYLHRLP